MKKIIIASLSILAVGALLLAVNERFETEAVAASRGAHAGHDHEKSRVAPTQEDLKDLFDDEGSGHDGHDEDAHAGDDHGDHDDHAAETEDQHAGHDHGAHAAEAADPHAGHDHGSSDGICPEHNVPEAIDALCQAGHVGDLLPGQGMKVRLASLDAAARAGVRTSSPQQVVLAGGVSLPGRVVFDRERLAQITPLTNGVVRQVHVKPGARVRKGDVMVEIAMPELAGIKAEFITARARLGQLEAAYLREQDLLERGITSRQEYQQAEAEFHGAQSQFAKYRNQLLNFGLTLADLETISSARESNASIAMRAPFGGVITDVLTATGEAVGPDRPLMTVADLDALWIELAIPASKIYQAETGAEIQARFDGLPGRVFSGRLFQVGAAVDERTRTLKALAEVANPKHQLKVGMFGRVQILSGEATAQLMIPSDAVQNIDGVPYVFVQDERDLFELRRVETGIHQDGMLAIVAGLSPDEEVVSGQGFALKSEVLKARLGASCADH